MYIGNNYLHNVDSAGMTNMLRCYSMIRLPLPLIPLQKRRRQGGSVGEERRRKKGQKARKARKPESPGNCGVKPCRFEDLIHSCQCLFIVIGNLSVSMVRATHASLDRNLGTRLFSLSTLGSLLILMDVDFYLSLVRWI